MKSKPEIRILRKETWREGKGILSYGDYIQRDHLQHKVDGEWKDIPVVREYYDFTNSVKGLGNT